MKVIPTLEEVRQLSGEDLIVNLGNKSKAEAEVRQSVNLFYRTLNNEVIQETYKKMEYLIINNDQWQSEYKEIISSFIYEEWNTEKPKEEIMLELINGSPLFKNKKVWLR